MQLPLSCVTEVVSAVATVVAVEVVVELVVELAVELVVELVVGVVQHVSLGQLILSVQRQMCIVHMGMIIPQFRWSSLCPFWMA